ncbi:MAG TPA: Flp family type IVb pilin [Candidimonas sp.]|nr:Flp family type IVb pilin [Candidimonas sp.]
MRKFIQSLARDESGVTALEYAILAGAIVLLIGGGVSLFSTALDGAFGRMAELLDGIAPAAIP